MGCIIGMEMNAMLSAKVRQNRSSSSHLQLRFKPPKCSEKDRHEEDESEKSCFGFSLQLAGPAELKQRGEKEPSPCWPNAP